MLRKIDRFILLLAQGKTLNINANEPALIALQNCGFIKMAHYLHEAIFRYFRLICSKYLAPLKLKAA